MNNIDRSRIFSCTMCFVVCNSPDTLMCHIVRNHQYDPLFKVICTQAGCGATYKKWKSFRQHIFRKHSVSSQRLNDINNQAEERLADEEFLDTEQNDENIDEATESVIKRLQWHAGKFIINIRENCRISQTAITHIIDGLTNLLELYSLVILKECHQKKDGDTQKLNFEDIKNVLVQEYPPTIIFSSIKTKTELDKFLINELNMVPAKKTLIATKLVWKKKKRYVQQNSQLCEVQHNAYVVPFNENLINLMMNDDVRDCVDNPLVYKERIFRTILDGEYYKENSFFKENTNALAIVLYMDELGVANPLASSSKTQKLTMFYWTLANIKPNLRSSQNAIQLLAIVKSCYLKQPGALNKVLKPFIDDIKNLQTQGINITINGVPKNYKGSLLFFSGDTPASALMGGFKESVSAHRPCRTCMFTKDEIKQYVKETDFLLRNKDTHQEHLEAINDNTTQATKKFWQLFYGINTVSPLADIPFFDVTMCLPQDCMHVLNEGVTELVCRLFLNYCITEKKLFTIKQFNEQLTAFDFGHFSRDKPAIIQNKDLADEKKLRQSAAQMFVLAHTLPFLIGQWIYDSDDEGVTERLDCLILLLQIMNLCLAYEIHDDSIDTLSRMIETFKLKFNLLFPDKFIPKIHFLEHIPDLI
ncbi:uncharacterized protein LOC130675088 [Microplitis mediator]|uniref:uncharacterized protein LOC130675088 n=1 Tax=Microplitis mediator TaxID=375433 RepID=UPI002555FE85|nr:uncharacterized protein LOC130675088 [Microplitis mediator]